MQLSKSSAVILGGMLATTVFGFAVGRLTAPTAPSSDERVADVSSPVGGSKPSQPLDRSSTARTSQPVASAGVAGVGPAPISAAEFAAELERSQASGWGPSSVRKSAALMERLAASDLGALAAEVYRSKDSYSVRMGGVHMIMGVYAEKDPEAAWAFANTLPPGQERMIALTIVASAISSEDPERAVALAATARDENVQQNVFAMAVGQLAQRDPQRAFEMIQNQTTSGDNAARTMHMGSLFAVWADKDLEAARAAAAQLSGQVAQQANGAILQALAQTKPEAAWKMASSMRSLESSPFGDPRMTILSTWAQKDPRAAALAVAEISDQSIRSQAMAQVIGSWAGADFDAALRHTLTIQNPAERSDALQAISGGAHAGNQERILTAVLEYMPPGDNFQNSVSQIFSSWASTDPKQAAEAIFRLPPGTVANQVASQVASQWAQVGNPSESLAWSLRLPEGEIRRSAVESTFRVWSSTDPAAAKKAVLGLPPAERRRAEDAVAQEWARKDPKAVIDWAATMPDVDQRRKIIQDATRAWSETAPEAAARFVGSLPEVERNAAMQPVVERWAARDSLSARAWLEKQPSGSGKNDAIRSLTNRIADEDPPSALQLAESITDPDARQNQRESIARTWLQNEPAAARNWITTSNLSKEARLRLLE